MSGKLFGGSIINGQCYPCVWNCFILTMYLHYVHVSMSSGFKKKEFRGKLAIAITANFINNNTKEEASVEEISGVSYIFNQKFVV